MLVEDPEGEFKLSPDSRRFVRVADAREPVRRFRRVGMEGFDNDGDGRINEDDLGGPDPNRNFAVRVEPRGRLAVPDVGGETRNVFEFQLRHAEHLRELPLPQHRAPDHVLGPARHPRDR